MQICIRRRTIREKLGNDLFESGYSQVTSLNWHDGHLFRDGCMNQMDLEEILDEWENMGFELVEIIDGEKHWKDVCVVNSGYGPSYPCQWIAYDKEKNIVWLKAKAAGDIIGPSDENG